MENKLNEHKLDQRVSLYERNGLTKFIYNNFIKKMDEYVFARTIIIFSIVAFYLGNNLNIFLRYFIGISIYVLSYRIIRFWIKRYLLYLMEFCYFTFLFYIFYLLFQSENMILFSICYMCSTGVMSLAIVLFNNQTHFNNTDHLTSSWIHTLPMITSWSIKWRHVIYFKDSLQNLSFQLPNFEETNFQLNQVFFGLLIYPFIFWLFWGILYYIGIKFIFRKFIDNENYRDSLTDFMFYFRSKKFWGDIKKNSILKFLLQHLIFFFMGYPIAFLSFYNYYFNTMYIVFIIVFLGWNTVRNELSRKKKGTSNQDDY